MSRLKYLLSSINLLNIILSALLAVGVYYVAAPSTSTAPVEVPAPKNKESLPPAAEKVREKTSPFPSDFQVIADQNLFHPDRKIHSAKKDAASQPLQLPDFVLYGTLITDDLVVAYMEDKKAPFSTPGREKRQTPLKPGESLSGFTLKEVTSDRVTMMRGEERIVVPLNDSLKPKVRELPSQPPSAVSHPPQQGRPTAPPVQAQGSQPPSVPALATPQPDATPQPERKQSVKTPEQEKAVNTFLEFFKSKRRQ